MKINVLITTNDAPIKLHALLESIHYFWNKKYFNIIVFESASTKQYQLGYDKVYEIFKDYKREGSYNKDILYKYPSDHVLFLNDNCLFTRPVIGDYEMVLNNPTIQCFTLRLGLNLYNAPKSIMFNYKNEKGFFHDINNRNGSIYNYKDAFELPYQKHTIYMNNQSSLIEIYNQDNLRDLNKSWLIGMKINITPYMYINNTKPIIEEDYNLQWRN